MEVKDEKLYIDLWNQCKSEIQRLCYIKLKGFPYDIEDTMSEIFIAFWEKDLKNDSPNNLKAWLYVVANNMINLKFREIYKDRENTVDLEDNEVDLLYSPDFVSNVENKELYNLLKSDIENRLSEGEQYFINLIYEDGMRLKEVAKIFGISYKATKQKHYRIINKIKKISKKYKM